MHGQIMIEGEKIVKDTLLNHRVKFHQLIATPHWILDNSGIIPATIPEILEATNDELARISSLETPPPVMAVVDIPEYATETALLSSSLSIALDGIQDPGNMGTIIRTANWFGIDSIICGEGCADISNPKVIQASMGAVFNLKVLYADLAATFEKLAGSPDFSILGTFMTGTSVARLNPVKKGIIIFGNESKGISDKLLPFINQKITIPPARPAETHVESLNVASSVAIVLALLHPAI